MFLDNIILIKILASTLIIGSGFIYTMRTYTGKIKPSPASWLLLTLISFLVLLTYSTSDATDENTFIVLSDFIEPAIIFMLVFNKHKKMSFKKREKIFLTITITVLIIWVLMHFLLKADQILRYAVYISVLAEILAIWPQIEMHFKNPENDRPLPWIMSGAGYLLGICFVDQWVPEDFLIPLLGLLYTITSLPLFWYRVKNNIKGQWI